MGMYFSKILTEEIEVQGHCISSVFSSLLFISSFIALGILLILLPYLNVITGKGSRSKNKEDPYLSKDLSILKYSVPDYIKNNSKYSILTPTLKVIMTAEDGKILAETIIKSTQLFISSNNFIKINHFLKRFIFVTK